MEEKSMTITKKHKLGIAISVGLSALIGYKIGMRHGMKCVTRGIVELWKVDPELQPAMWKAIKKKKKK